MLLLGVLHQRRADSLILKKMIHIKLCDFRLFQMNQSFHNSIVIHKNMIQDFRLRILFCNIQYLKHMKRIVVVFKNRPIIHSLIKYEDFCNS